MIKQDNVKKTKGMQKLNHNKWHNLKCGLSTSYLFWGAPFDQ